MNIYVSWSVDQLDGLTASALMADNVGELRMISQGISRAADNMKAWAMASGGSPILDLGIIGAVEVPADRMTELPAIAQKFADICEGTLSIGVGMTLSESYTAMRYSQQKGGDQISLYHSEMEQELDASLKEGPDELANLGKADPANTGLVDDNQHGAGGKFSAKPSEGHGPIPGANMAVATPEDPIGDQPSSGGGLDGAHFDANGGDGNTADDQSDSDAQDPRAAVVAALQQIKQQAPILEQMKLSNPQAFAAVKSVVDAMILMAQGMATEQAEGGDSESAEVQKSMPDDPKWDRSWNVTHAASHGTYHMSGGMSSHSNGSSKVAGVNLHYVSKKGKKTDLGNHADKHAAHSAREEHHDRISAGFKKEELVSSEPSMGAEARRELMIEDANKAEGKAFAVGTEKDGKIKVQHSDPATGAAGGTAWRGARAGEIMSEDGHPVSARNPGST